jgi:hypothetical protein
LEEEEEEKEREEEEEEVRAVPSDALTSMAWMTGTGSALWRMMVSSQCASCVASGRFPYMMAKEDSR